MMRPLLMVCGTLLVGVVSLYALAARHARADLTYVNPSGIHTLDPARMSWTQDFRVALNIWEGLTTWHGQTTKPVEGAAFFPPRVSKDRLTYTFTIHPDARWSNGDPVTARDFVRGWRRGMEPGTAADYAFLLTDHIAGAAEYVRWRRVAVGALTALKLLRDGWRINAGQAEAIAQHAVFQKIRTALDPGSVSLREPNVSSFDTLALQLRAAPLDWGALYDSVFQEHTAELDGRFGAVGVVTPDEHTLVVTLTRPCLYFVDLTALPVFLPCHESIELLREHFRGAPITAEGLVVYDPQWTKPGYHRNGYPGLITNGPYRLNDWVFKRRLRLTVNPFHRAAATITCRSVDMVVFQNVSAAIMAYEAGEVDFLPAMDVPYDHEIARLAQSGERPDFHLSFALATYFLNFNCAREVVLDRPNPFTDPRVRQAFSLAVDKRRIVDNVLKRGDRVAHSFVPPGSIAGYEPPKGLRRNVKQARALLAQAGYPGGRGLPPVQLLYTPSDERICQALARMWTETLGVRVELSCKESKTFAEDKSSHRFMIARGNWFADYGDPTTFLDCLTTGNGNNDSGYANPRYDALLTKAAATRDPAKRMALLRRAEAIVVEDDLPILPILHYSVPIAIQPYVKGLFPNARLWFPFKSVTIQP